MSTAKARLSSLVSQFFPTSLSASKDSNEHTYHIHTLSPTFFLPRAAVIEPDATCIYHKTANGKILRRNYRDTAKRAAGFGYYIRKKGFKRVGILCPNTPAFLEAIFGIGGSGAVNIGKRRDDIQL